MTTRDKVLQIRAEQPNAHAAQIAQTVGVTSGRVYQILKEQGLATTIPGAKGRPRQKATLWVSRKAKALRPGSGGIEMASEHRATGHLSEERNLGLQIRLRWRRCRVAWP
jgi:predicted transcriptional regulator